MKCVILRNTGPEIENLAVAEREDLTAGPGEVRVRVAATALNRADLLQRRGLYPPPPDAPAHIRDVPGLEFAGHIDQLGESVTRWRGGERVFGIVAGGGYASQVVTHADLLCEVPEDLSDVEAAAVPEAFITAFDALVLQAAMSAGERVLIHAAASGVGTAAVQLVHVWDAEAIGTAGSRAKLERVRQVAPLFGVNYRETDFKRAIEEKYGPVAVDVILDVVGAAYWERNIALLAPRGRLIVVGRMGGSDAVTPLGAVMSKRLRIVGTVMRSRSFAEKVAVTRAFEAQVLPLFRAGRLKAVVDATYALDDVHRATDRMENNENVGKIVLTVG
jgi:putative PIG3 family NAD(P)H quinone oxidoreductase